MNDLKPCPFCENKVEIAKGDRFGYFIECLRCDLAFGVTSYSANYSDGTFNNKKELAEAWNKRFKIEELLND